MSFADSLTLTIQDKLNDVYSNFKISSASDEYKQRRKQQMLLFLGASTVTIMASRIAYRSTISRQYLPTFFQGNHSPPTGYNFTADAAAAVGTGTLLAGSVTSMMVFGTCWLLDVSSFKEFGWRMRNLMGGDKKLIELAEMKMDEESAAIQDGLNDLLDGKYDEVK